MTLYNLLDNTETSGTLRRRRRRRRQFAWALLPLAIALVLLARAGARWLGREPRPADKSEPASAAVLAPEAPDRVWPLGRMVFPTPRQDLLHADPADAFMPTAAGRVESAFYGSTRTGRDGRPSFHEGVDIAPVRRDRSGRALDDVFAVADGRIAHVSRHPGNSNYGIYLVLFHDDAMGEIYTLYAHLASVADGLRPGQPVAAGSVLGRMGNTPARIIPVARSHLHFEVGTILHARFDAWLKARDIPSPHGNGHGWNLLGLDPMGVWTDGSRAGESFALLSHVRATPVAFEWTVRSRRLPDYFRRYPALWHGEEAYGGPALVVAFSEGGVPLRGRPATEAEAAELGGASAVVSGVREDTLGRNGRRLIESARGQWRLSERGRRWLDMFLF